MSYIVGDGVGPHAFGAGSVDARRARVGRSICRHARYLGGWCAVVIPQGLRCARRPRCTIVGVHGRCVAAYAVRDSLSLATGSRLPLLIDPPFAPAFDGYVSSCNIVRALCCSWIRKVRGWSSWEDLSSDHEIKGASFDGGCCGMPLGSGRVCWIAVCAPGWGTCELVVARQVVRMRVRA